jgi:hypothetical protein
MDVSPRDDIYLFLFSTEVDNSNGRLAIHLPTESAWYYWSLDPNGLDPIPEDVLDDLSLPEVHFLAMVFCRQWSREKYDAISDFHSAKGFDPDTQDIALKLGYPLVDIQRMNNLIDSGRVCHPFSSFSSESTDHAVRGGQRGRTARGRSLNIYIAVSNNATCTSDYMFNCSANPNGTGIAWNVVITT